jgi:hypothetical protein
MLLVMSRLSLMPGSDEADCAIIGIDVRSMTKAMMAAAGRLKRFPFPVTERLLDSRILMEAVPS